MNILVPGAGVCGSREMSAAGPEFMSLGPLPVGSWIERVEVALTLSGGAPVTGMLFGLAVVGTPDANAANMIGGRQLVQNAEISVGGVPVVELITSTDRAIRVAIFPGVFVAAGPLYLLALLSGDPTPGTMAWIVSAKMMRFQRSTDAVVGVGGVVG